MNPLLYRGIAILIGAGLVSALIVANRQTIPLSFHTAAFFFMVGMLGTAVIVLIRLHRKGGAKLRFSYDENSPGGWLLYIVFSFLWLFGRNSESGGAVDVFGCFVIGAFAVAVISRYAVGEVEK